MQWCNLDNFSCSLATLMCIPIAGIEKVSTLRTLVFTSQMVAVLMVVDNGPFGSGSASTGLNQQCTESYVYIAKALSIRMEEFS